MLVPGRVFGFVSLLALCGVILAQIHRAKRGVSFDIRRIPALDSIDEGIGRATEMGRPVHFSAGISALTTAYAPVMLASLEYLSYIARQCAKMGTKVIATAAQGDTFAVTAEVVKSAYLAEGASDRMPPDAVRFLAANQYVYASSIAGILNKEQVATNFMIGHWADETLFVAESGHLAGCLGIGGTTNQYQIAFFVAALDYVLLSDEIFAGSAYLSRDPVELGAIAGQDFGKAVAVVLLVLGVLFATANSPVLVNLMRI